MLKPRYPPTRLFTDPGIRIPVYARRNAEQDYLRVTELRRRFAPLEMPHHRGRGDSAHASRFAEPSPPTSGEFNFDPLWFAANAELQANSTFARIAFRVLDAPVPSGIQAKSTLDQRLTSLLWTQKWPLGRLVRLHL